jgi:hypothetical protein
MLLRISFGLRSWLRGTDRPSVPFRNHRRSPAPSTDQRRNSAKGPQPDSLAALIRTRECPTLRLRRTGNRADRREEASSQRRIGIASYSAGSPVLGSDDHQHYGATERELSDYEATGRRKSTSLVRCIFAPRRKRLRPACVEKLSGSCVVRFPSRSA